MVLHAPQAPFALLGPHAAIALPGPATLLALPAPPAAENPVPRHRMQPRRGISPSECRRLVTSHMY